MDTGSEQGGRDVGLDEGGIVGGEEGSRYWCYECQNEVRAQAENSSGEVVCPSCTSGFIEVMTTARIHRDVRRARRRRRRLRPTHGNDAPANEGDDGDSYHEDMLGLLRLLARATRDLSSSSAQERENIRGQRSAGHSNEQTVVEPPPGREESAENENGLALSSESAFSMDAIHVQHGEGEEIRRAEQTVDSETVEEHTTQGAESVFLQDGPLSQEVAALEEHEENESEAQQSASEFADQGSVGEGYEDEWEEVDNALEGNNQSTEQEEDPECRNVLPEVETSEQPVEGEDEQSRTVHRSRRPRNLENALRQHLQEIFWNLGHHNVEVRFEMHETDTFVGNPGDYLDAQGYEQFLQQMFENDNTRRGAPPAAKSAVEELVSVTVEQKHLDDGSALCAICKDTIPIDAHATQMPCLHLYHSDCILLWLNTRNSCPVCRYELPTDEEQKHSHCFQQSSFGSTSSHADTGINRGPSHGEDGDNRDLNIAENGYRFSYHSDGREL